MWYIYGMEHFINWNNGEFGHLVQNSKRNHLYGHVFDPYSRRRYTPALDKRLFNEMRDTFPNECGFVFDSFFAGCLDAPEEIPMGSTLGIRTIGGWDREEYNNLPRGTEDYKHHTMAADEVAKLLKSLLAELDTDDEL